MAAYDKLDWHRETPVESGQPERNAFAHIAFYLAWQIGHDLHDPRRFRPEHVAAVKSGAMSGWDLLDEVDSKLVPQLMSPEGRACSDARYRDYLAEYEATFADMPKYGVADVVANLTRILPVIDRLYGDWVAEGRPPPSPEQAQDRNRSEAAEWQALGVGSDFDALRDVPTDEKAARLADVISELETEAEDGSATGPAGDTPAP